MIRSFRLFPTHRKLFCMQIYYGSSEIHIHSNGVCVLFWPFPSQLFAFEGHAWLRDVIFIFLRSENGQEPQSKFTVIIIQMLSLTLPFYLHVKISKCFNCCFFPGSIFLLVLFLGTQKIKTKTSLRRLRINFVRATHSGNGMSWGNFNRRCMAYGIPWIERNALRTGAKRIAFSIINIYHPYYGFDRLFFFMPCHHAAFPISDGGTRERMYHSRDCDEHIRWFRDEELN